FIIFSFLLMCSSCSLSFFFFFSCSSDLRDLHSFPTRRSSDLFPDKGKPAARRGRKATGQAASLTAGLPKKGLKLTGTKGSAAEIDRKSTRLNSSHVSISYAVFCLKKKKKKKKKKI